MRWEGDGKRGHYLDKGFNVKFSFSPSNAYLPEFALGLDDFAGTSLFSKEYLVSTYNLENLKFSLGIGWGKLAGEKSFKNPLSVLSSELIIRPGSSSNYNLGGSFSYDQWFRGESSLFGGLELQISKINGLNLKVEYDPFDYFDFTASNRNDTLEALRKKDSNINLGLSYSINDFLTLETSFIKGNTVNISISAGFSVKNNLQKKNKFRPQIEKTKNPDTTFYKDLLFNLNANRLYLQTANLESKKLDIAISSVDHRNPIRLSSYAAFIAKEVADVNNINLNQINIEHINVGISLNEISYIANNLDKIKPIEVVKYYTEYKSSEPKNFLKNEFQPTVPFPVIFSSFGPYLVSHIGNPEKFFFGGAGLQHTSEIQFSRNLILTSELNILLADNFEDTISGSQSLLPHVRTDLNEYLKAADQYITRMQLDYIWSPAENFYARISGGLFEEMYGGFGGEILYRPFDRRFSIGIESFMVKQRDFDQRFKFRNYQTSTSHINFAYKLFSGIEANISYGRYLAKDDGFTFDLSRITKSGFEAGIYFTKTNISAELFGEGSFDKGFYFQIPLDLFRREYNSRYTSFKISPLTRDGGAKLKYEKGLNGLIFNSTFHDIDKGWEGFLN